VVLSLELVLRGMDQRRSRSVEGARAGAGAGLLEAGILDRLTNALERLGQGQARPAVAFRTPTFDGQGDVELFISQFQEVAAANQWEEVAVLLHLREALKENARDCGRAPTTGGILTALRARYGLSPREARTRLNTLHRDHTTTLQEHAMEVQRLVGVAYADLPLHNRMNMVVDMFCSTLGNAYLQRHLLAVPTPTLEHAVQAGNEFLQIKPSSVRGNVRVVEEEAEPSSELTTPPVSHVGTTPMANPMEGMMASLTQLMSQLTAQLGKLQSPATVPGQPGRPPKRELMCWKCGQPGHVQRRCPRQRERTTQYTGPKGSGNGLGPQW
jgi:hypothetical protein